MLKTMQGTVLSAKMESTLVVSVEKKLRHPIYRKVIVRHRKFKVHNTLKGINKGDVVVIQETTPISKEKHFKVIKKVEKKG